MSDFPPSATNDSEALKAAQNVIQLGNWLDHEVRAMASFVIQHYRTASEQELALASEGATTYPADCCGGKCLMRCKPSAAPAEAAKVCPRCGDAAKCSAPGCPLAAPAAAMILDADFLSKIDVVAKRLMATTDFHPDAHVVLEAGIMLAKSLDRIVNAERQLDAIAGVIEYPKESWRIAGCEVLAHAVADLQRNYIALRDKPSAAPAAPVAPEVIELRSAALGMLQAWNKSEREGINVAEMAKVRQRVDAAIRATGTRSASGTMAFSHAQAFCILKVRDALLAKDIEEAWHWLYTLDSKQIPHDPFKPWANLERISASDSKANG